MSYSFNVKTASKAEALDKVQEELARVVAAQPVHDTDCDHARGAIEAFMDLLADDDDRDVRVAVSGSIWKTDAGVQQAAVSVDVSLQERHAG